MIKKKALNRILTVTISLCIIFVVCTILKLDVRNDVLYSFPDSSSVGVVYLPNNDNYLARCEVYLDNSLSITSKVQTLLETMIKENNKNSLLPSDIKPILPRNTEILEISLKEDILSINFSKELLNITDEQAESMISSIIYTVTEFKNILGIEILADGNMLRYIPGTTKEIPTVLTRDFGINKTYNISNNNNIKKVFLYYYSDDFAVPVTKYLNSNKEKIEIIVESLTNPVNYSVSLSSYLNYNDNLISYDIETNNIVLNFEDLSSNEKAIKALISSVFANYDVENVSVFQNDHKILQKNKNNIE